MSLRAVSPLAENHCSINSLHCSFLKDRACFLILFYPSSPRTCVSHSIYPYFYSIALIEAFCVPDHILVTADTAVKTWSRSLSARCLRCSSSNAVCGGYQNSVSDFSSLCFTMVKATQTLKWIHHLCTAIYRSALGTLKCFVPTADIKLKFARTCFPCFSFSMLEPCFLGNKGGCLSQREMWWVVGDWPPWL